MTLKTERADLEVPWVYQHGQNGKAKCEEMLFSLINVPI
jgi:hypothetical protein